VARTAWVDVDAQTVEDEEAFATLFGDVLSADDHARRLDRLVWAGRMAPAQRLLFRLDPSVRALAEARIALRQSSDNAPGRVALVPAELQADPGLVYDQVRWHRRKGSDAFARQLLTQYRPDSVQPEQFWQERAQLARSALSDGNSDEAYRVAADHGFTSGSELADSEWLAGWIALRFLQQPDVAGRHFLTMFENVRHPVSRARGAYWSARALQTMQETEASTLWHKTAAQHGIAFYGQLSAA
jgi:soluble lytic murein transglycosylase